MLWNDILQKCAEQHWCKHSVTEKHSLLDKYKTLGTHGMKDKDRGLCLFHWKSLKSTKHIFLSCYCKNAVIEVVSTSRSSEGKFIARGKTRCSLLISSPLLLYPLASWQIGNKTQPVTFKACLSFTRQHMEPPPPHISLLPSSAALIGAETGFLASAISEAEIQIVLKTTWILNGKSMNK